MISLKDFFTTHNGKKADFDGNYGAQCKDLFSFYNRDVIGNPDYVPGDAWEIYDHFPAQYYRVTADPEKGDIAVWGKQLGKYGHIAIVWDNGKFFSQNYPLGEPCSLQDIPIDQLSGYLRPLLFDNHETRMWNKLLNYNKKIARYLAGLPDEPGNPSQEPTVLKASVKYTDGGKLALIRKFGDNDYRIRIDVSVEEFLNSGAGEPVPITPKDAEKMKTF